MKRVLLVVLCIVLGYSLVNAQTEEFGTWIELEFTKKFLEKFEFSVIPEVRLQDDFTVDKYQFDTKLAYEPVKFLKLAAAYRYKTNVKKKEDETTHRFVADVTTKTEFGRVMPSFRTRITNYNDADDDSDVTFIRPRLKVAYDIKGSKIRPYASFELFHDLNEKEIRKSRYDIGFVRKLGKLHRIGLYYRLQDYFNDQNSIHILGVDYRLKL